MTEHIPACDLDVIILAAGQGTRMRSTLPKVLHRIAGRSMLGHVIAAAEALGARRIVTVIGPHMAAVARQAAPHPTVEQTERRGTAHAVAQALPLLDPPADTVLVLYGDVPLITPDTLRRLIAARGRAGVAVLGFTPPAVKRYGRLIVEAGQLVRIVEDKDATPDERTVRLCNAGMMAIDGARAADLLDLDALGCANAQGEYYLTDIVARARALGLGCVAVETDDPGEVEGVNSRAEQAAVEALLQTRLRAAAMDGGATLIDPASIHLAADTVLGRDVVVHPHVVFGPGVSVADGVEIRSFSHIEGARIGPGAIIGPFARLRPGTVLDAEAHVGNFVELKNSHLGAKAKANHLSYIGDSTVGAGANIGAGTITCNYDGFVKARTEIGAGAFIGSNSALVAPLRIGAGAIIAAGSTITKDVTADAIALARGEQREVPDGAARFRAKKQR